MGFRFVHHSIAILCHEVPNPNLTIRNFFIAVPGTAPAPLASPAPNHRGQENAAPTGGGGRPQTTQALHGGRGGGEGVGVGAGMGVGVVEVGEQRVPQPPPYRPTRAVPTSVRRAVSRGTAHETAAATVRDLG
jgi:hypothetical protein